MSLRKLGPTAALLLLASSASLARAAEVSVGAQLRFGTKMAQRGLWNEALFRFRQAERIEPNNARVLNNIGVALEAVGKFEDAEATYKRAAQADPTNPQVKKNLARFVEFYQGYKVKPKTVAAPAPAPTPAADGAAAPAVPPTDPPVVPAAEPPPPPPAKEGSR
jgi:Flp pilus assembly protein TadD